MIDIEYSQKDQALLDRAKKELAEYEKYLIRKIESHTDDPKEKHRIFINDRTRQALIELTVRVRNLMIPKNVTVIKGSY